MSKRPKLNIKAKWIDVKDVMQEEKRINASQCEIQFSVRQVHNIEFRTRAPCNVNLFFCPKESKNSFCSVQCLCAKGPSLPFTFFDLFYFYFQVVIWPLEFPGFRKCTKTTKHNLGDKTSSLSLDQVKDHHKRHALAARGVLVIAAIVKVWPCTGRRPKVWHWKKICVPSWPLIFCSTRQKSPNYKAVLSNLSVGPTVSEKSPASRTTTRHFNCVCVCSLSQACNCAHFCVLGL